MTTPIVTTPLDPSSPPHDVRVYTADDIDQLADRHYANGIGHRPAAYLRSVVRRGIEIYVANAPRTRMEVLVCDDLLIPLVINDGRSRDCYTLSPTAHYVRYVRHEIRNVLSQNTKTRAFAALTTLLGGLARITNLDRHVSINNWLLSTNPPLRPTRAQIQRILRALGQRFPDHAWVWRSVGDYDAKMRADLTACGFQLVINRDVYYWYPRQWPRLTRGQRHNARIDIRFLRRHYHPLRAGPFGTRDCHRMAALYRNLYIEKHAPYNADFTAEFFQLLDDTELVQLECLEHRGNIVGFVSSYDAGPFLYTLYCGYDTGADRRSLRQYRSLVAWMMQRSEDAGRDLFLSTGAAGFKKHRGAVGGLEYEGVYTAHLPRSRRLPWQAIDQLTRGMVRSLDLDEL